MAPRVERTEPPLVVIVGPTASGKTALAVDLAQRFDGEIICADSRTIYRDMDIGTAKPTAAERGSVPHFGLDLVDPGERFTAADFQKYANKKISDIRRRGKVPFLVGGTGLYVDGVLFDYQYGKNADVKIRTNLENWSLEELKKYCSENNIKLPENDKNKRYVIRAIEQNGLNDRRKVQPASNSIIVGIATEKDLLRTRIERRSEQIFTDGIVEEAKKLGKMYGWDSEAMTGNIYPIVHRYLHGEMTLDEAKKLFMARDWQLAKRQLTWFRRNPYIKWLELADADTFIAAALEK